MGKSITPRFTLQVFSNAARHTASAWNCRRDGRPTPANIEKYIAQYVKSQYAGGANAHVAKTLGVIDVPHRGIIRDQFNGQTVVAEWEAPLFWALPSA